MSYSVSYKTFEPYFSHLHPAPVIKEHHNRLEIVHSHESYEIEQAHVINLLENTPSSTQKIILLSRMIENIECCKGSLKSLRACGKISNPLKERAACAELAKDRDLLKFLYTALKDAEENQGLESGLL